MTRFSHPWFSLIKSTTRTWLASQPLQASLSVMRHLLSSSLEQVLPEVCNVKVHVSHRQVRLGLGIVEHGELKKFIILNIGDDRGLISPIRIVGNCLIL